MKRLTKAQATVVRGVLKGLIYKHKNGFGGLYDNEGNLHSRVSHMISSTTMDLIFNREWCDFERCFIFKIRDVENYKYFTKSNALQEYKGVFEDVITLIESQNALNEVDL